MMKKDKKDKFLDAMGNTDEINITEYQRTLSKRKKRRVAILCAVTVLCLLAGAVAIALPFINNKEAVKSTDESSYTAQTDSEVPEVPAGPFAITDITAQKITGEHVHPDSDYTVTATGATAELLRDHLVISGSPEYTVMCEGEDTYRVSLLEKPEAGKVISLAYAADGVILDSWAFDVADVLTVTDTVPENGSGSTHATQPLVIEFSLPLSSAVTEHITIAPYAEGEWQSHGRIHIFTPESWQEGTTYTVTVEAGYSEAGYTTEEHTVTFTVKDPEAPNVPTFSYGNIHSFSLTEEPRMRITEDTYDPSRIEGVRLYAFPDVKSFIAFNSGEESSLPASFTEVDYTLHNTRNTDSDDYTVPPLKAGYYLAEAYKGADIIDRELFAVTDTKAYFYQTEEDMLIYSSADTAVRYGDVSVRTDGEGCAVLRGVNPAEGETVWILVGEETPLPIKINNLASSEDGTAPSSFAVYRIDYTNSFRYYGYVASARADARYTVRHEGAVQTVYPDENGCFWGEMTAETLGEYGTYFYLYEDEEDINTAYCSTSKASAYRYFLNYDKYVLHHGETANITVTVTHASGVPAAGKALMCEGETVFTDEYGRAYFSYTFEEEHITPACVLPGEPYPLGEKTVDIYAAHSNWPVATAACKLVHSDSYVNREEEPAGYKLTGVFVDPELANGSTRNPDFYREGATFSGEILLSLTTVTRELNEKGEYVEAQSSAPVLSESLTDVKEYLIPRELLTLPTPTDSTKYYMTLDYTVTPEGGETETQSLQLCSNNYANEFAGSGNYGQFFSTKEIDSGYYVRYSFASLDITASPTETVPLSVISVADGRLPEDARFIRIIHTDKILKVENVPLQDAAFIYDESYGESFRVSGAILSGGEYYPLSVCTVTDGNAGKRVDISITTDGAVCSAGSALTLNVKASEDGVGVPCAVELHLIKKSFYGEYINPVNTVLLPRYNMRCHSSYFDHEIFDIDYSGVGTGGYASSSADYDYESIPVAIIKTDENGECTYTLTVPDSNRDFIICATAVREGRACGSTAVPMDTEDVLRLRYTLPEATAARPVSLFLSAEGMPDCWTRYSVTVKESGETFTAAGMNGATVQLSLTALPVGTYSLCAEAVCEGKTVTEELTLTVNPSRVTSHSAVYAGEDGSLTAKGGATVQIYNDITARYISLFNEIMNVTEYRSDRLLALKGAKKLYKELIDGGYTASEDLIKLDSYGALVTDGTASEVDYPLTALSCMLSVSSWYRDADWYEVEQDYLGDLIARASVNNATLYELSMAEERADGLYLPLIGIAYADLGDYRSAKRIYDLLPARSDEAGADALRAILATYVRRDEAWAQISTLMNEEKDEPYLSCAMYAYMLNRVDIPDEGGSAKLSAGGAESEHALPVIGTVSVVLPLQTEEIPLSVTGGNVRVLTEPTATATAYVDTQTKGVPEIVVDISMATGERTLTVCLPQGVSSMLQDADNTHPEAYTLDGALIVLPQKNAKEVRIPLSSEIEGYITLPPIRINDESGAVYYTEALTFAAW